MDYKTGLVLVGIVLTIVAALPYIRDIRQGKTKPHIITWLIWSLIAGIGSVVQIVGGAGIASLVLGVTALVNLIIFGLAIRNSDFSINLFDSTILFLALASIILWIITDNPHLAATLVTFAAMLGFIPTFKKSIAKPHQETSWLYLISGIKQFITIAALSAYNFLTLLLPICFLIANMSLVLLLKIRRKKLHGSPTLAEPVL